MAIIELPENKPGAPNDLTEVAEGSPTAPANLAEVAESAPIAPNNLTELAEASPSTPSNLTEVSESTPGNPSNLLELSEVSPGNPTNLTELAESSPVAPTNLTEVSEASPGNPTNLTEVAESAPGNPTNLTETALLSPGNPTNLTEVAESRLPRQLAPRLAFNFAEQQYELEGDATTLEDIATYTRANSAYYWDRYINADGQYDYILKEDFVGTVTNLVLYSQNFENAAWTKSELSATNTREVIPNTDGKQAQFIRASTNNTAKFITQSITAGVNHTISVWCKPSGAVNAITIYPGGSSTFAKYNFDTDEISGEANFRTAKVERFGDYFRISMQWDSSVTVSAVRFYMGTGGGTANAFVGNGTTDGLWLFGAQAENRLKVGPYVATFNTTASQTFTASPRIEYDPATGEKLGYLSERTSTNLIRWSERMNDVFWVKSNVTVLPNVILAPDGTKSADLVYPASSGGNRQISQSFSGAATQPYTASFYVKSAGWRWFRYLDPCIATNGVWFDVINGVVGTQLGTSTGKIKNVGNGWYRCEVTGVTSTSTAYNFIIFADGDNSFTATANGTSGLYLWGGALEQSLFATSYIRTESSTASRATEGLTFSGGPIPSAVDTAQEVSFSAEFRLIALRAGFNQLLFETSETNHELYAAGGALQEVYRHGTVFNSATSAYDVNSFNTVKVTYDNFVTTIYRNGVEVFQGAGNAASGSRTSFVLGTNIAINGGENLDGHIKSFTVYSSALTADEATKL